MARDIRKEIQNINRLLRNAKARRSRVGPLHTRRAKCKTCGQTIGPFERHEKNYAKHCEINTLIGELYEQRYDLQRWLRTLARKKKGPPKKYKE